MRISKKKMALGTVLAAGAIVASGTLPAFASTGTSPPSSAPSVTHPSQHPSILVSPTRGLVKLDTTGSAATSVIQVQNTSVAPEKVRATKAGFNELPSGALEAAGAGPFAPWLTISPTSFTLQPGQIERVSVIVQPTFKDAGDHYLGVSFFLPPVQAHGSKGKSSASATVSAGVQSELIVQAPGKVVVRPSYALTAPGWSFGGPVNLGVKLDNKPSNAYLLANGVHVTDGSNTVASLHGQLVLAGANTTQAAQWASPPFIGVEHLNLVVNGRVVASTTVIRFPLFQFLGGLALVLALVLLTVLSRRRRRRSIDRQVAERVAAQK